MLFYSLHFSVKNISEIFSPSLNLYNVVFHGCTIVYNTGNAVIFNQSLNGGHHLLIIECLLSSVFGHSKLL